MVLRTALGAVRLAQRCDPSDIRQSYAAISRFASRQSRNLRLQAQTPLAAPARPQTVAIAHAQRRTLSSSTRRWSEKKEDTFSSPVSPPAKPPEPASTHDIAHSPEWVRRLVKAMPHTSLRRPTRDDLLSATTSFWEALRIRFKWFTIRGFRPYRADDWSAFASWALGGVGLWIVIGTFFAVVFSVLNSLQLQEWLATRLGRYLTESAGVSVVFESAIVPRFSLFGDSRISLRNVYISRGPVREDREPALGKRGFRREIPAPSVAERVSEALGIAQEELSTELKDDNFAKRIAEDDDPYTGPSNWTHFHLAVDSIDVSLSLWQWLDSRGLVKTAVVRGVRGVIDRSHIRTNPSPGVDRRAYRHKPHAGDFDLSGLTIEDALVTVYQPDRFRPFTVSVFSAQLSRLRKQWLFLDLLSADSITGQADNCLFSLHKPQTIGRTSEKDLKSAAWKRLSRFRIDGLPIDHLQSSHDNGPISWITSGRADLVADIRFPLEPTDEVDFNSVVGEIVDKLDEVVIRGSPSNLPIPGQPELVVGQAIETPSSLRRRLGLEERQDAGRVVSMDLDIRFKDVKASLPLYASQFGYVTNGLIRPIVAFINSNRTLIPVKCRVDIPLEEWDGSWTAWHVGLLDAVAREVYEALAHHVQSAEHNNKRATTVGLWSLKLTAQAVLSALRNLDHVNVPHVAA